MTDTEFRLELYARLSASRRAQSGARKDLILAQAQRDMALEDVALYTDLLRWEKEAEFSRSQLPSPESQPDSDQNSRKEN